jgi:hypothetical protein
MSRRVSIAAHQRWQASLTGGPAFDPDDDLLEDVPEPTSRRTEGELSNLHRLLDEIAQLEGGEG